MSFLQLKKAHISFNALYIAALYNEISLTKLKKKEKITLQTKNSN